ncbi:hypothetical protein E6H12_10170 [Candidatus Bathyarchaeota archaeon]|nr:MAG: hypothetical protein E6H12_10170 [Candidatus Bathyarchaeota archaeon]
MSDSDKVLQDMEEAGDGMTKYGNMMLEFIKKEIFEERKNISVEEVVTLVAALTDLSVSLLSKFRKDPIDPSRATEIGRDVFKHMVGKIGFDVGQLGKSSLYA